MIDSCIHWWERCKYHSTARKTVSPLLLSPAVRYFSRVGSSWQGTMLKQLFPPQLQYCGKEWACQRPVRKCSVYNNLLSCYSTVPSTDPKALYQFQHPTSCNRWKQSFTSFQWSGNHSLDMLHKLIKITQLLGKLICASIHCRTGGEEPPACRQHRWRLCMKLLLVNLLALPKSTSSV